MTTTCDCQLFNTYNLTNIRIWDNYTTLTWGVGEFSVACLVLEKSNNILIIEGFG